MPDTKLRPTTPQAQWKVKTIQMNKDTVMCRLQMTILIYYLSYFTGRMPRSGTLHACIKERLSWRINDNRSRNSRPALKLLQRSLYCGRSRKLTGGHDKRFELEDTDLDFGKAAVIKKLQKLDPEKSPDPGRCSHTVTERICSRLSGTIVNNFPTVV